MGKYRTSDFNDDLDSEDDDKSEDEDLTLLGSRFTRLTEAVQRKRSDRHHRDQDVDRESRKIKPRITRDRPE